MAVEPSLREVVALVGHWGRYRLKTHSRAARIRCWLGVPLLGLALIAEQASAKCSVGVMVELSVTMTGLRPMINAKINGSDAPFLVDSGAFYSVITPSTAADLNLTLRMAPMGLFVQGVGGSVAVSLTTVHEFTLANIPLKNVDFIVGGSEVGSGAAGVLGQNVLRVGGDVEYDLANGFVRLMKPHECDKWDMSYWATTGTHSIIPIEWATLREPYTTGAASINGKKIRVMFDTGAGVSIVGRRSAERAGVVIGSADVVSSGVISGVGTGVVQAWIVPVTSFAIGNEEIRNTHLLVSDKALPEGIDMLIGADFFLSHHLYVSGAQRKLYFTYNGGPVFNLALAPAAAAAAVAAGDPIKSSAVPPDPTDAAGFARRGAAYTTRRDLEHAIADLTRACEMDPTESRYFHLRGIAFSRNGQVLPAAADFDTALRLKPDDLATLNARASLRVYGGDRAGAASDLDAIDRLAKDDADARYDAAKVHITIDQFPQAIRQLDRWIRTHATDGKMANALNERCWARALWGQELHQALRDCDAAVKRAPNNAAFLDSRGLVRLRLGEYEKSIADYDAVLRADPRVAWSLFGRGVAKLRLGQADAGAADIASAKAVTAHIAEEAMRHGIVP